MKTKVQTKLYLKGQFRYFDSQQQAKDFLIQEFKTQVNALKESYGTTNRMFQQDQSCMEEQRLPRKI